MTRLLIAIAAALMLQTATCGQRGPLELPDAARATATTPAPLR
jgi:predicted small lipoprotein YifL